MKCIKSILSLILIVVTANSQIYAQNDEERLPIEDYIGGSIHLKNMHLWRGYQVSSEVTSTAEIYFKTKNDILRVGLWNGMGVNGGFKELDYYVHFKKSGFEVVFWDVYNFSPEATYNNKQAFNYIAKETGHYFDLRLSYRLQKKIPLKIFWSTIFFGRDRDGLNEKNRYSSYLELEYPVFSRYGYSLDVGVGGAFALVNGRNKEGKKTDANFYTDHTNVVDIHLRLSKTFKIGNYNLPVAFMPMWNPPNDNMNMEVSLELLSF